MGLSFGTSSPVDKLEKARRDLERLRKAEKGEDTVSMADALSDLAVGLTGLRDWLKQHPGVSGADVEMCWSSVALSSFRDIANTDKHRIITKYSPSTKDALLSAPASFTLLEAVARKARLGSKYPRLKIVRVDKSRHRAVELGLTAITECETFFAKHGIK